MKTRLFSRKRYYLKIFFSSWYVGPMERTEANELLDRDKDSGVFLVRDSNTIKGDFVLCVK